MSVERNCMLKLKYLFENFELAKCVLINWEHDEENLEEYLNYFRISSNAVYPFSVQGKRCFLRLAPVDEKQKNNLAGELEFLQYLNRKGYSAMEPVKARNGSVLLKLDTKWGEYYASVFEGVRGIPVEETDYREGIMSAYGKALGRLHRLSMEYQPVCRKWSYIEVLAWVRAVLMEYQDKYPVPEKMYRETECVEQELSMLECNKETFGLVHYDFEPDNVFYEEADGSCHVIDFEDGMYHFFLVDVEQVLDALSGELEGDVFQQAKQWFLQGYTSEKELEPDYEKKLPLMRRFCNVFSYARLIRCIAEEVPEAPEWMNGLRERLAGRVRSLEDGIHA